MRGKRLTCVRAKRATLLLSTPMLAMLLLAPAPSALAQSGTIEEVEPETVGNAPLVEASNWQRIVEAMAGVVHGPRGTARRIGTELEYRIAGKTGTAQVVAIGQNEEYDAEKLAKKLHDHGLFIAFAPVERPRIAVSVIVENGGSGSGAAAPPARAVIEAWLGTAPVPAVPERRPLRTASGGVAPVSEASTRSDPG